MKSDIFYKKLNDIIGDATPFKKDCGMLCNSACCKGDGGMYLFPHEKPLAKEFEIKPSNFKVLGKNVPILFCNGNCNRRFRPLACRIFPLMPYITVSGDFKTIFDPRGRAMCPVIFSNDLTLIDKTFFEKVEFVGKILMLNSETAEFIYELSRLCDEYAADLFQTDKPAK